MSRLASRRLKRKSLRTLAWHSFWAELLERAKVNSHIISGAVLHTVVVCYTRFCQCAIRP